MKEDIDKLWADYLNREPLSEQDLQSLETWMQASPKNQEFGEFICKLESQKDILKTRTSPKEVWEDLSRQRIKRQQRRRLWGIVVSCAAIVILLVGIYIFMAYNKTVQTPLYPTYGQLLSSHAREAELILPNGQKYALGERDTTWQTIDGTGSMQTKDRTLIMQAGKAADTTAYYTLNVPYGAEYDLVLPDGSKVYLNAGSVLRYPERFNDTRREVFLSGEAYLEVVHNEEHPFVVRTRDIAVRVLGTIFNINAYPDNKWVKTTLVEGKVETQCGDRHITMEPGTQVAYDKEAHETAYFPVNTHLYTSWKDGYYDFENMELGELAQILSRWYDVQIVFARPELRELRFSGRLKRYDSAETLFKMLDYVHNVTFTIEKGRIIIWQK